MNEILQPLIADDKPQRLAVLEQNLVLNSFKERGAALTEISQGELYKPAFATFEDYCQQRWSFKRAYGYRLIQAAAVAREMSPIGDIKKESHARALLKLPAAERAAAFKAAIDRAKAGGRALNAQDFCNQPSAAAAARKTSNEDPRLVQKETPIQDQLRALWAMADPANREQFLEWTHANQTTPPVATPPITIPASTDQAVEKDTIHFRCSNCSETFEDDSLGVTRYSCNCGNEFSENENGSNRCPDCNRFASVAENLGCPECDDGELEEVDGEAE